MRKLFFIAVAGLIAMPLWAAEAPGTDNTADGQNADITCDVLPWTEIAFNADVDLTMTPAPGVHHAQAPGTVDVYTNDEITLTLTGGDLTRVENDDPLFDAEPALPIQYGADYGTSEAGKWFAIWDGETANVLNVDEGVGDNPTRGFMVSVDATSQWWELLAGQYTGVLTVTVTAQ